MNTTTNRPTLRKHYNPDTKDLEEKIKQEMQRMRQVGEPRIVRFDRAIDRALAGGLMYEDAVTLANFFA